MHGAAQVNETIIKSISAVKPSRGSGQTRAKKRREDERRGGMHLRYKVMVQTFDGAIKALKDCPPDQFDALVKSISEVKRLQEPVTRLVFVGHLTAEQGIAARRYADVVRKFERYFLPPIQRSARSAALEPMHGEDDEIERRIAEGTLPQYEANARKAKRDYQRVIKVLARFADPLTGRNVAKDVLDDLCLNDREPAQQHRRDIAVVLSGIAAAFGQVKGERR
jgi:hypothetical protein